MGNNDNLFEVVISGVGGKFPKSENIEELQLNLNNKVNMVTDDDCRWSKDDWPGVPPAIGKVSVAQKLDDTFMGINSRIVKAMDPLTRCLLERSYEAIIDAGLNPSQLNGSQISVYTASCVSDSEAVGCDEKLTTPYWLLAHVRALLANRISNILNLHGPSYNIDSSWIGGIEVLKQAANDIAKGRTEAALVGVTNIIWYPDMAKNWIGLNKLSEDGLCRSFDENASGYGRSEGVVVLFLQRSNEALRSYGTVVHVNARVCMEKALNLIKPTDDSLRDFYNEFYKSCEVSPKNISFLEADGSGCKYYDEMELKVASDIFCGDQRTDSLPIGSIKSNLGHCEAASSLVSIVKALITLDTGIIPPNINYQSCNQNIDALKMNKMEVVTKPTKLDGPFVATTTLGMPSSIGHVLLKQHSKKKRKIQSGPSQRLVLLSSRNEKGIADAIDRIKVLPRDDEHLGLIQNVFRENIVGYFYRGYVTLDFETTPSFGYQETSEINRPVWFVFGGMGSQWPGMASDLMQIPCFANSIKRCDKIIKSIGYDIIDILTNPNPEILQSKPVISFLAITTMQIAFVDLLAEIGIHPAGMLGHSLGENGCAYADNCFDTYGALMAAYGRGKVAEFLKPEAGLMAAVGLNYKDFTDLPPNIDIGCHNSEGNVTLSGPINDMKNYLDILKKRNVFVKEVNSNGIAYHSRMVYRQAEFVKKFIEKAVPNPKQRSSKWVSTSIPESNWSSDLAQWSSGEYHANNFKSTVLFSEGCKKVPKNVIVIEIAPHGLFQGILKSELDKSCKIVSLAKRGSKSPLKHFLNIIGELYSSGLQINLNSIYPQPKFPVSRGTPSLAPLVSWNHDETWPINTHYDPFDLNIVNICLHDKKQRHFLGHEINKFAVVPSSFIITEVLHELEKKLTLTLKSSQIIFEEVLVHLPLIVSASESQSFSCKIRNSNLFEVIKSQNILMSGKISYNDENQLISPEPPSICEVHPTDEWVHDDEIYSVFMENDIKISNPYDTIQKILIQDRGYLAKVTWSHNLNVNLNTMMQIKMFFDLSKCSGNPLLPFWIRNLIIDKKQMLTFAEGSLVYVRFDFRTNVIRGPGIEIEDFKTTVFQEVCSPSIDLRLQKVQFISQPNPNIQNLIQMLSLCLQTVKNCCYKNPNLKLQIKINDAKFIVLLKKLYEIQPYLKEDFNDYTYSSLTNNRENKGLLLITENFDSYLKKDVENCFGRVFVLTKTLIKDEEYTTIFQKDFDSSIYYLITQKFKSGNQVMQFSTEQNTWKKCLSHGLTFMADSDVAPLIIIKTNSECPIKISKEIEDIDTKQQFRYIILLKNSPFFDMTNTFFSDQVFKGLRQNILRDNNWGNYMILPCIENKTTSNNFEILPCTYNNIINLEDIKIKYISHIEINKICKNTCFQYSGIDKKGNKVMGILRNSKTSNQLEIDDVLQWVVKPEWSLDESTKLPLTYSIAYYYLAIKYSVKSGDNVLIHDASSTLGQAFIRIALSFGCNLYLTTYNNEQNKFLQNLFPQLNVNNILQIKNGKFEIDLKRQTKSIGCKVVVHTLPTKYLLASLKCLETFGIFVHIGTQDINVDTKFGMSPFLKSIALYGVKDFSHVLNSTHEVKQQLKKLVQNGICNNIVCKLDDHFSVGNSCSDSIEFKAQKSVLPIISKNTNESFVEENKLYIIIGPPSHIWLKTVNWLLSRDVKKLIFIIDGTSTILRKSQRIIYSLIQQYSDVSFIITSGERLCTRNRGEELIREFSTYSKVSAIFCIEMSKVKLTTIDTICKKVIPDLKHFICMQSDAYAMEVCESRNCMKTNCINLQLDKSMKKPEKVFNHLEDILKRTEGYQPIEIKVCDSSILEHKHESPNLIEYLPKNIDDLLDICGNLPDFATFEKCTSNVGIKETNRHGLLPVFIIPGLGIKRIQPLINKIMYPVFCAKFPSYINTIENSALSLLWPLRKIQNNGPFNIVGESWGGNIAVELAKIIEGFGERVNLILLDGCPDDNKEKLIELNKSDYKLLEDVIEAKGKISDSVMVLKKQLDAIRDFVPSNTQLSSNTIIAQSSSKGILDTCINFEKQHCGELTVHISNDVSYNEFISSLEIAKIINENAYFKW